MRMQFNDFFSLPEKKKSILFLPLHSWSTEKLHCDVAAWVQKLLVQYAELDHPAANDHYKFLL